MDKIIYNQNDLKDSQNIAIENDTKFTLLIANSTNIDLTLNLEIKNEGILFELYGLYLLQGDENVKLVTNVIHSVPNSESKVNIRGVLKDKSNAFWSGDVIINKNAKNTTAFEENKNLVLNKGPKVTSIPNLEILNGNINGAGHASSTQKFDELQLFYLMSRGIEKNTAEKLVVQGFIDSQLELMDNKEIENIVKTTKGLY